MTGLRRVGKTFLVNKFFENQDCKFFYVVGIHHGKQEEQLAEFSKSIGETFYHGANIAMPSSWMKAFEELHRAVNSIDENRKVVLFFDEFPWMVTPKSRLLQTLEYYWNKYFANNSRLKLIVCGSNASWIIKNILYNKGGLHNRTTRQLILKPFTLKETKIFLKTQDFKLNNSQILQLYMAMGGIPHYLKRAKHGHSAIQNINDLCFQETGILFDEFEKLFGSLFNKSETYVEIINIIASSRYGVSRAKIGERSRLSTNSGRLTERLKDLEKAGFIKSFLPLGHSRQGIYYRLIDEYCYFYLKWIQPEKNTLLMQDVGHNYWHSKANSAGFNSWAGYAFETICYKHILQIKQMLQIKTAARVGTWQYIPKKSEDSEGAQIDLLFDRDDDVITICEIKYSDKPFVIDKQYAKKLLNKVKTFRKQTRTKKQIFIAMIATAGLKETMYSEELISGVVTLDDLFK